MIFNMNSFIATTFLWFVYCHAVKEYVYFTGPKRMKWPQAQAYCQMKGANLASIHSQQENNFIQRKICKKESCWIGYTDEVTEGQFKWVDGSAYTWDNWGKGEPNNFRNEDYTALTGSNFKQVGKWNDLRRDRELIFVCKTKIEKQKCRKDYCYFTGRERMKWHDARAYCEKKGAKLASIHSKVENNFILDNFCKENCWIGYTDEVTEGQFKWVDGSAHTWDNWNKGEPNNKRNEDYTAMRGKLNAKLGFLKKTEQGFWNDLSADKLLIFVCKATKISPTGNPTIKPTNLPTGIPTETPTAQPTNMPTGIPTETLTFQPTLFPTRSCDELMKKCFKNKRKEEV
jgi:hypothetical protein